MKLCSLLRGPFLAVAASVLLSSSLSSRALGDDRWTSLASDHFLFAGNAAEGEMREIAAHLEKFRAVLSQLSVSGMPEMRKQTIALVFRGQNDYKPFSPLLGGQHATNIAGHFQWSPEVNYIVFSAEQQGDRSPSSVAVHEYVHGLIKNSYGVVPPWFDEGLAEYYSTFELSPDGRRAILGRPIESRVLYLRDHGILPLSELFAADHSSPEYLDQNRRSLFYAESWALVHYLLNGEQGRRKAELLQFLDLQISGTSLEESVRQAFHSDLRRLEDDFRGYVRTARYPEEIRLFTQRAASATELRGKSLTEAEAEAYLGDLLVRAKRFDEAEAHLQRAARLNPELASAQVSLGLLRLEQNLYAEAQEHLEKAIRLNPENFLAHYYLAEVLCNNGAETDKTVAGYIMKTGLIRAELKRAIALRPDFQEGYRRLAEMDLQRSVRLDETIETLQRAIALWPEREDFMLLLARVFTRMEEFDRAREVLYRVGLKSSNPRIIAQSQNLLAAVREHEEYAMTTRREAGSAPSDKGDTGEAGVADMSHADADLWSNMQPCDMPEPGPQIKKMRFMGRQVCGRLEKIECVDNGSSILSVESEGRTLRFYSAELKRTRFVSYTAGLGGRVECGERKPANQVLLTYRPSKGAAETEGEVIAVEFVPPDWSH